MSHQSTHHHHLLPNSIPPTHHHHHQPNLIPPIKPENNSDDDDVVFLSSVPKVPHTPEDYDPECQCSTCLLATKLLAECTCEECKGTGQPDQSSENVPIANAVSPTNGQPSSSSIQNNDASTSEHTNANEQDDDHSRSSTPDYRPRFFDDKSGDSSSDDSEDDSVDDDEDDEDFKELDHESGSDRDNDKSEASYGNQANSFGCPKCESSFKEKGKLLRHYRGVHQEWKPYYCKLPKCKFEGSVYDNVVHHVYRKHFNMKNREKAKRYIGKRENLSSLQEDPIYESILGFNSFDSNCPKCGRNFTHRGHFKRHLRSHENVGFRCTWLQCGFFFSDIKLARKHLLKQHLKGKLVNSTQISEHLIKVDPKLSNYNEHQNNDASTSEHTNANDQDDDRKRSATQDYLPPFFDDESGDSNSDDSEDDDDSVDDENENNDKCGSKSSANSIAPVHTSSKLSSSKCHKRSFDENQFNKHTKTNDSKRKHHKCPLCGRNLPPEHIKYHIRTHSYSGFRCVWPNCGFFYAQLRNAKKHVCVDHLQVDTANSQQTNRYLVKVDPKTGETTKIRIHIRLERGPAQHMNGDDQVDDDRSRSSTPDYRPRSFDVESGDLSSDDSGDDDYKEHDHENESDDDGDESDAFSKPSTSKCFNESNSKGSNIGPSPIKCPKCERTFTHRSVLLLHYRGVHQEWKPYYCRWPKCNFTSAVDHLVITHTNRVHFNSQNRQIAKTYVGKRKEAPPKDRLLEQIVKFDLKSKHINVNDDHSKSSTPDYQPRFFDESGDSSSDDCEDDADYKELDQKSESDEDACIDADYVFSKTSTCKSLKISHTQISTKHTKTIHVDTKPKCRLCGRYFSRKQSLARHHRVIHQKLKPFYCKWPKCNFVTGRQDGLVEHITLTHFNHRKNVKKANLYVGRFKLRNSGIDKTACSHKSNDYKKHNDKLSKGSKTNQVKAFDCPKCESSFDERGYLLRHYRRVHHEWKAYYCKWPKCEFVAGVHDSVVLHANQKHFNSENRKKARIYVGMRKMFSSAQKDPIYESLLRGTIFNANRRVKLNCK